MFTINKMLSYTFLHLQLICHKITICNHQFLGDTSPLGKKKANTVFKDTDSKIKQIHKSNMCITQCFIVPPAFGKAENLLSSSVFCNFP